MPAYNEGENLTALLPDALAFCRARGWRLLLVDDGSKDDTRVLCEALSGEPGFHFFRHKLNRGYGAALKTAARHCDTEYCATMDADGQHRLEDIERLFSLLRERDADLVVGSRKGLPPASRLRGIGKFLIRAVARMMMKVPVHDLNSGMKVYRTALLQQYLHLAPNTMSFSDIITLVFISNRHLVLEHPISVMAREKGSSTIGMQTAFQTVMEILNIVILFNPARIFLPLALMCTAIGLCVGLPILFAGRGVTTGSLLGIFAGIVFFLLGLIAEQLSSIRKHLPRNGPE
ncbi:MAG: glycosyltransferase family 2 protein [Saprospiraceae bacterium]|jgi:glycosyltransferase involved in cell wall biosynthesis|nr:glycosyltransferase family 2 protein [Saprospiraceae bacterium]MBP9209529.1 glycosyltransferase family 2 protein [Saprospiraceae bacterium]MBV6472631.1 Undecaprenyl-phosphate 4-deoxy-4-formamido-L-arabinose transferase [Saprospiraceae bacterium]